MIRKIAAITASAVFILSACATAQKTPIQETKAAPMITMGNGEFNSIRMDGLTRADGVTHFSETRIHDGVAFSFRGDSVKLTFPEVVIENAGFIVLHPVMDGRPNGDVVSGFTYLKSGVHKDVTVHLNTPADAGRKFLAMLHTDIDNDRVLDFVFVEDGINVEDTAVLEGTKMIAHIFSIPE
ncbi:MAG: hypothetical protein AAGG45_02615 [Pseudomonadota bacterium]